MCRYDRFDVRHFFFCLFSFDTENDMFAITTDNVFFSFVRLLQIQTIFIYCSYPFKADDIYVCFPSLLAKTIFIFLNFTSFAIEPYDIDLFSFAIIVDEIYLPYCCYCFRRYSALIFAINSRDI